MMRGPGSHILLERALIASAHTAGAPIMVERSRASDWHSATFSGTRHMFEMQAEQNVPLDHWLGALPDRDFALQGHLVADLAVVEAIRADGMTRFRVEALTVAGVQGQDM